MAEPDQGEAGHRAAAHAAYCAAYHLVAGFFGLDRGDRRQARHDQLLARLVPVDASTAGGFLLTAQDALPFLQRVRVAADYQFSMPLPRERAASSVHRAGELFDAFVAEGR
ncbi:hypothetical protein HL658_16680 [Azospirillum sp. RWY-5-1]|uniref:HEPN domain-containing protein n=1 Tax=Azospirillum oleiclasticum TaxID=2735135 RepID=A0ABX2TBG3_9PROT|nr:hypothetical protein [Azospirillum oleiclasticum]NYZ14193.1 hypothetical protein [Azospirillum oleiclasticum]NYZ21677.1 hypothetical protein [Azospirillum oleiclasticum]